MGLDQIIRDFVIDLNPFELPPNDRPDSHASDDEQARMVEVEAEVV